MFGNLQDGMTLAEIIEHYSSIDRDAASRLLLLTGDALCREALSPLVGQRRRRSDGSEYTVTQIVGADAAGDWSVTMKTDDGEEVAMAVADMLEDEIVHTWRWL